ncbi:MAG: hemolysin family protein [Firmicutes bacterium]|nr:hemolysin family protein [Bacillota bacterium]
MPDWLYIALIIISIGISALLTAIRSAIRSVSRIRIGYLAEQDVPGAKTVEQILQHPGRLMSSLILVDNVANITAISLATILASRFLASFVVLVSVTVMLFIVLIFGEIVPRTFGTRHAETLVLRTASFSSALNRVLNPVTALFISVSNIFIRLFGGRPITELPVVTEEEIITMGGAEEEEGVIEEEEREMIHSIFEFGDTIVREVMVPRMDMVAVNVDAPLEEVLSLIIREGHSRIPVYEETVDNVVGIIYAKDLLIQMRKGNIDIPIRRLMRPAYYVPELKKVDELLRELQKKRLHMAIVVDEYGGTAGLVTIEDLLEEIVGEIFDEYDLEETLVEYIDEHTIRMDARVNIFEANEILNANLSRNDIDTIGGFVYSLFGRIPNPGEQVRFENLTFKVEKVIGRRISKILITKEEVHEEKQEEAG